MSEFNSQNEENTEFYMPFRDINNLIEKTEALKKAFEIQKHVNIRRAIDAGAKYTELSYGLMIEMGEASKYTSTHIFTETAFKELEIITK